jgi:hypothetical protein
LWEVLWGRRVGSESLDLVLAGVGGFKLSLLCRSARSAYWIGM